MQPRPSPVIVFDSRPEPVAAVEGNAAYGFPLTVTTGRRGPAGPQGDENVLVLEIGETEPPEDTPDGTIIYRLLEEI